MRVHSSSPLRPIKRSPALCSRRRAGTGGFAIAQVRYSLAGVHDLSITKTADVSQHQVARGQDVTLYDRPHAISANADDALNAQVTDPLPAGYDFPGSRRAPAWLDRDRPWDR